jgi:hypothetical protein
LSGQKSIIDTLGLDAALNKDSGGKPLVDFNGILGQIDDTKQRCLVENFLKKHFSNGIANLGVALTALGFTDAFERKDIADIAKGSIDAVASVETLASLIGAVGKLLGWLQLAGKLGEPVGILVGIGIYILGAGIKGLFGEESEVKFARRLSVLREDNTVYNHRLSTLSAPFLSKKRSTCSASCWEICSCSKHRIHS